MPKKTSIVVLGGGFAGVYAAQALERRLRGRDDVEITLVNRENFFLFTPMLHEVAASDCQLTHIVNPIRKMLKRAQFFHGDVLAVDTAAKTVTVAHGGDGPHPHLLRYDHLVLALGSTTNFFGIPGLAERAFTMKSLGDAIAVRNRLIENLEHADFECCKHVREAQLTVVVAGGGFAGVETVGALNDFVRHSLRFYRNLSPSDVRMVLVHPGKVVLPELREKLGRFTQEKLADRGVEVRGETKVVGFTGEVVHLSDGTSIRCRNLVWTAGTSPHPLVATLPVRLERGRVVVGADLAVPGHDGLWALGDCAAVPDVVRGGLCPPTAQHATRQAKVLARNVVAASCGCPRKDFSFKMLGQLASIGRRSGVASLFGLHFSGFFAWWLWRTVYLMKLPRLERKVRVALDWTLDLVFSKDLVQCPTVKGTEPYSLEKLRPVEVALPAARPLRATSGAHRDDGR